MEENNEYLKPGYALFMLFIFVLAGFLVAQLAAALTLTPFFNLSNMGELITKLSNPTQYPEVRLPLLLSQGVSAGVLFIVTPLVYMRYFKMNVYEVLGTKKQWNLNALFIAFAIVFVAFPSISFVYEWNMTWNIPGEFGAWATAQEEQLKILTAFLLKMDSFSDFLLTFLVVAVIAGVGEELLFRGLIQTHLGFLISNPHIVIWITALFFGVFHLQFYGVVPRVLLGALMGYLFYWSGNIKYSMIAHITNNGFQVVFAYIMIKNGDPVVVDEEVSFPFYLTILSFCLTIFMLLVFKKSTQKNELENSL